MGFLRFVLESEGYEVVAQASSASELARVLAVHEPDVVVLDDGIGATAVQMTHDVSPAAKVILVWPGAVVPIGGYARVDPGDVLRSLGPTVARAVGTMPVPREDVITPGWADRLKKDPAALREKLEEHDGLSTKPPNVTDLQRRGQHLHPVADTAVTAAPLVGAVRDVRDEDLAPVLPLSALSMPPAAWASTLPDSAFEPIAAGAVGTAQPTTAAGEWNRRLGTIALGGAVAASAVVIALTLGGAGGHQGILSAAGFENAKGIVAIRYAKDAGVPRWQNDPDVIAFEELRKKYLPNVDPDNTIAFAGYGQVVSMAEILRRCGDELTRENVLNQAAHLAGFHSPFFLDGVTYSYTPEDYTPMKTLYISIFNGKDWDISDRPVSE